jgi:hypothetical protein
MSRDTTKTHAAFIWFIAELLRGDFKQSEFGRIVCMGLVARTLPTLLGPCFPD